MHRIRPNVDIIKDLLEAVVKARPDSVFAKSLLVQYQERGGLSKKQLQGLYGKASKLTNIPPAKLATLEAIILKKPAKYKSVSPAVIKPLFTKDEKIGEVLDMILQKYPQHKRVLFFRSKYNNNEPLSPAELAELQKFKTLLLKADKK